MLQIVKTLKNQLNLKDMQLKKYYNKFQNNNKHVDIQDFKFLSQLIL